MSEVPQHFLITVQRMCTADEADLVVGWSAVVEQKNLANITLVDVAEITRLVLRDTNALTNARPMTEAEIAAWREEDRERA